MTRDADAVVVGGGLTGSTMALALAQAGMSVALVDRASLSDALGPFDGRAYAIAQGSRRMLGALGLWDALADDAGPILTVKASDGHAGRGPSRWHLAMDHAELEEGPLGYMVEDRHLRRALTERVGATPGIAHHVGAVMAQDDAAVTLADGNRLAARIVIGADGRRGGTARRAGIARRVTDYHQTALVAAVEHAEPHGGIAQQFFMPGGPLAILPLTGNRCSIVWVESTARADVIAALPDDAFLALLRPRFGHWLGAISLVGTRSGYPLTLSVAERLTGPRTALVGDAAHGVHPIAGQGLNLGLRDVATLAEVLADARRRGEDFGTAEVLARYVRWRRFDAGALVAATDLFNRAFSNDNPLLRLGRDLGLGLAGALPPLRRRLMREAAGLAGDLPRLMRGERA